MNKPKNPDSSSSVGRYSRITPETVCPAPKQNETSAYGVLARIWNMSVKEKLMLVAQIIFIVFPLVFWFFVNEEKYSCRPYPCHGIPCVTAIRIGTAST